jgi:hypothetical protein
MDGIWMHALWLRQPGETTGNTDTWILPEKQPADFWKRSIKGIVTLAFTNQV